MDIKLTTKKNSDMNMKCYFIFLEVLWLCYEAASIMLGSRSMCREKLQERDYPPGGGT